MVLLDCYSETTKFIHIDDLEEIDKKYKMKRIKRNVMV